MEILAKQENLSQIRVPSDNQAVYKDECVYSYDSPETSTGLYISLTSFLAFGERYAKKYAAKTGYSVFLHIIREKFKKLGAGDPDLKDETGPERKITRLAIGVEGGYTDRNTNKYDYKDKLSIVIIPETGILSFPYEDLNSTMITKQSVEAIIAQESAIAKLQKLTVTGTWDGEVRQISKYCDDLKQLDNGRKIPPSGWKCEKCDLTNNLWLNLSDGSILCGRKFFDGSGGNDHAVHHYKETGHPLAVKLGTISGDGKADVFSYPEDDMVIDSKLEEHLAHFGINIAGMQKTDKSMVELELDINQRIGEWSLLTESESELIPLSGPGYTGMKNLGNSCYINSVMQVLFIIPDFIKRYSDEGAEKYFMTFPADPANDFNIQMAKLGNGLLSGKYSSIAENSLDSESTGISPVMFKNIIGKNHPDFSTKQQQDACEFYLHIITMINRNSRNELNPADALNFCVEDRVECESSKKVKYTKRDEYCLPLIIPLSEATNLDEVKEYEEKKNTENQKDIVRPKVTLQACLNNYFQTEIIEQFYSSAINGITTAKKTTRLASMPDYLMIHLKKFTLGDDWTPKKLDVSVQMPEHLDLSSMRSTGLKSNEEMLADVTYNQSTLEIVFDQDVLSELVSMGFPIEACKRALFKTQNMGLEAATQWLMTHITDSDFADTFVPPGITTNDFVPNADSLEMLMNMGFDKKKATKALKETSNNIERATDWIFSHADDICDENELNSGFAANDTQQQKIYRDGIGKYKLLAFISHMGSSAQVGHYVCHIRKDEQWAIFNDSKVAVSQNPPKDLGYLYLYKREK